MPVNLSIKNVPDEIAARLKERARLNHRSLQGELMAILQTAMVRAPRLSIDEIAAEVRRSGVISDSDSASMVREDRDLR